jgi:ssDNA-binding Zn-finger/Zn-ribbon topoisomerase 1
MKTIIQEGRYLKGPVYVAKCRKCKCKFTYEKEDIRRVGVYGFEHIIYVDCPWCEETIWLNRLKFFKKNKR